MISEQISIIMSNLGYKHISKKLLGSGYDTMKSFSWVILMVPGLVLAQQPSQGYYDEIVNILAEEKHSVSSPAGVDTGKNATTADEISDQDILDLLANDPKPYSTKTAPANTNVSQESLGEADVVDLMNSPASGEGDVVDLMNSPTSAKSRTVYELDSVVDAIERESSGKSADEDIITVISVKPNAPGQPVRGTDEDIIREVVSLIENERGGQAGKGWDHVTRSSAQDGNQAKAGSEYELLGARPEPVRSKTPATSSSFQAAGNTGNTGNVSDLEAQARALLGIGDIDAVTASSGDRNRGSSSYVRPQGAVESSGRQDEDSEVMKMLANTGQSGSPQGSDDIAGTVNAMGQKKNRPAIDVSDLAKAEPVAAKPVRSMPKPKSISPDPFSRRGIYVFGPTKPGSSLEGIADSLIPADNISIEQMMYALYVKNPNAFTNGDISRLKDFYILNVPLMDELQAITPSEAESQIGQLKNGPQAKSRVQ